MRLQVSSLISQILRVILYKTCYLVKFIRFVLKYIQMGLLTNLQGLVSTANRYRRIVFALVLLCIILLYLWPTKLSLYPSRLHVEPARVLDLCVDSKLQRFSQEIQEYNTLVTHHPKREEERHYMPFVGNGYIGTVARNAARLYLKHTRSMSMAVNFYPITVVHLEGVSSHEATVVRLTDGIAQRIKCLDLVEDCVTVVSSTYAHRAIPSVLVQEIRITNPLDRIVTLELDHIGASDWKDSKTIVKTISNSHGDIVEYEITSGYIDVIRDVSQPTQTYIVHVAAPKLPQSVSVQPSGVWKHQVYTVVKYAQVDPHIDVSEQSSGLFKELEKDMAVVLKIDVHMLQDLHRKIWQNMWQSGFSISRSLAAGAINGDRINATMYYMLSQARAPLHEDGVSDAQKLDIHNLLHYPDRCYDGHHTLQNTRLWDEVRDMDELNELIRTWDITLEKQGCASMIQAGASGVLQAMVLSIGALKFSNQHLEFGIAPSDLHRDYTFRRLNYGNNTHVNISVAVNDDNRADMYVALDRNDRPYYACEAGCQGEPIHLSKERVQVPVKVTKPLTAILYITSDQQHMLDLKDAIHIQEIKEAPAHEHHVMALHRHGHHLGGLPALFWVSIGILVVIFHMFLFKLVFNEYCQDMPSRYVRSKYNV